MADDRPTPLDSEIPGGYPETPASTIRQSSYIGVSRPDTGPRLASHAESSQEQPIAASITTPSSDDTRAASERNSTIPPGVILSEQHATEEVERQRSDSQPESQHEDGDLAVKSQKEQERPTLSRQVTEDDVYSHLRRRSAAASNRRDPLSRATTQSEAEEQAEINRLMSRMFGKTRQANSEEEKTRHRGVVFKNLTVKGMGVGAALQPTFGDVFLGLPRTIKNIVTKGPRQAAGKPPIKTILDNFNGVIKPGEMCLVLGRPGSGCSTFLKVIGNQRFGYESIDGDVVYGGTDAKAMLKKYRGEVIYTPEDDLHYATLSVKNTLKFALKTKTPSKESRNEGETAKEYVQNFLKSVVKLFWIEHTLQTKVGSEYVRGVSGGEKKRVSIAEAMITKASIQAWDNSTRGLDASTALEYVSSLRSLTNAAGVSTAVALYQAGEQLYDLFDKVLLIDGGRCCYFGPADRAKQYFLDLGFVSPNRWTTADFLTSTMDSHERHVKEGFESRIPRSADQFGDIFAKSEQNELNLTEIAAFEQETEIQIEERSKQQSKATAKKNYTIPFHKQVWACTHRQFLVMFGDQQSLAGKWGGILFQAVIVGSLFYNMPPTAEGVFPRGGVLFFMLLFNALLALAELTSAFESRPICKWNSYASAQVGDELTLR